MNRSTRALFRALAMVVVAALTTAAAHAQTLRIELRDSVSGLPVAGALVAAANESAVRVDGLTNDRGLVTLRLPTAGTWALSVRRIGLTPRQLPGVRVEAGAVLTVPLAVSSIRQTLARVRVTARAGACGRAPEGTDRTALLWEQISLALRATTLSRGDTLDTTPLLVREKVRELSPTLDVLSDSVTREGFGAGRPYAAADPDSLAALGYVRRDSAGDISYFGPDENVLQSPAFLATHCFSVPRRDQDASLAELRFTPVNGRRVPDVEGTVYVDTASGELRTIEFQFVAPRTLVPQRTKFAGGEVALRRLQSGRWIVSNWSIRMPRFARRENTEFYTLTGYREVSGAVVLASESPP
jgi:hypothetical protein